MWKGDPAAHPQDTARLPIRAGRAHPVSQRIVSVAGVIQQHGLLAAQRQDLLNDRLVVGAAAGRARDVRLVKHLPQVPAQ